MISSQSLFVAVACCTSFESKGNMNGAMQQRSNAEIIFYVLLSCVVCNRDPKITYSSIDFLSYFYNDYVYSYLLLRKKRSLQYYFGLARLGLFSKSSSTSTSKSSSFPSSSSMKLLRLVGSNAVARPWWTSTNRTAASFIYMIGDP